MTNGTGISSKAICLSLTTSRLGTRRRVPRGAVEADVQDKTLLKVAKVILAAGELDAIGRHDGEIKVWLYARALQSPMFRTGVYLIPLGLVEDVEQALQDGLAQRQLLIDKFLASYDEIQADAARRLGALFNPADYPPKMSLAGTFAMRWQWIGFDAPAQLESLNRALWEQEKQKAERAWTEAADEIRQGLREALAELVEHLAERLAPAAADGKPKVFRDTAVGNLTAFLDLFDKRDVTNDQELQALVGLARAILGGVNAEQLRSDWQFRNRVRDAMQEVKTSLDQLVVTRGRKVMLDDEEGAA